jgi:hypothetical protein
MGPVSTLAKVSGIKNCSEAVPPAGRETSGWGYKRGEKVAKGGERMA